MRRRQTDGQTLGVESAYHCLYTGHYSSPINILIELFSRCLIRSPRPWDRIPGSFPCFLSSQSYHISIVRFFCCTVLCYPIRSLEPDRTRPPRVHYHHDCLQTKPSPTEISLSLLTTGTC